MGGWAPIIAAGILASAVFEVTAQEGVSRCGSGDLIAGTVARIVDGRSFILDDGREIRLAAVEVPAETTPAGQAAREALAALLADRAVQLRGAAESPDRYGRIVAHAFVAGRQGAHSIVHEMLRTGHARVAPAAAEQACAAELLAREHAARTARIGLWADPRYGIINASNLADLVASRGQFAVVEGSVVSVRERGSTIYVNFGRRWSQALTVTISKRHGRIFAGAGLEPKTLDKRRLRVRGWVELRNGPQIEASRPEQIEIAELN